MGAPKPVAGYPSTTAAVHAMREAGKSTRDIAAALGINANAVSALEASAIRAQARRKVPGAIEGRGMVLPLDVLNHMRRPASRRGIEPHELAVRIIKTVVMSGLIDAVLDDDIAG
ncbi:hypothetical protein [Devosia sp.]|uniref:hypothetical protein n=1 Tax=Devosia sp. TaxID=1871048 RepID=UPI001ACC918E|nr:hypothetical protein [Devosia sp.]MBN9334696.1 hypothetical protein [Devosia sp.]